KAIQRFWMDGWLLDAPYASRARRAFYNSARGFMPGWGTGSFENEDAQSFLVRLNSLGVDDLRQMLIHAADKDYLEAPESGAVVAAAEVVAALAAPANDEPSAPATPQQILDWLSKSQAGPPSDLVEVARHAVEKVRTN